MRSQSLSVLKGTKEQKTNLNPRIALHPFCFPLLPKQKILHSSDYHQQSRKFNHFTDCGNFSHDYRTLASSKTDSLNSHLKMSVNAEHSGDAPVARDSKRADEPITRVSPDLIEEKIKANFEPLTEQISTLTQLLNQLTQENSTRISPTAGPSTHRTQTRTLPEVNLEPLEPYQEQQLGVRNFRPTVTHNFCEVDQKMVLH